MYFLKGVGAAQSRVLMDATCDMNVSGKRKTLYGYTGLISKCLECSDCLTEPIAFQADFEFRIVHGMIVLLRKDSPVLSTFNP